MYSVLCANRASYVLLWGSLPSRLEFSLCFLLSSSYLIEHLQLWGNQATAVMSLFISHGSGDSLSSARWFLICFMQLATEDGLGRNHQEYIFPYPFSNAACLAENPAGAVARIPTYNCFYIKYGQIGKLDKSYLFIHKLCSCLSVGMKSFCPFKCNVLFNSHLSS